ncbi:MAG: M24 family metallopeptidase [Gammaproteobacteria bacterium]|nr:M24 family metallopeptidase [Gammaproteobacteria bacterium]
MAIEISQQEFAERRQHLFAQMANNSIAIIPTATEKIRSGDTHYPFSPQRDFYYLTSFSEPRAVAILIKHQGEKFILFNRASDPDKERWEGTFVGQEGAIDLYAADESYNIDELEQQLLELLSQREYLYYTWGNDSELDKILRNKLTLLQEQSRMGEKAPDVMYNLDPIVHEMRLCKSPAEITAISFAAKISTQAHIAAMKACRAGRYEYQLQAEFTKVILEQGCTAYAYDPIFASGNNACTLHYCHNRAQLKAGELILVDAGCEYQHYASDITRTYPINGKFSAPQKALYNVVLKAQLAAMTALKPGLTMKTFADIVARSLTEGLVELGILKGNVKKLYEEKTYRRFYYHGPGHWLGLDTHDAGAYKVNGQSRALAPGMVLTNEPGIYIAAGSEGVDKQWWGMGIRIEDEVLITEDGNQVLSTDVPKEIKAIEQLMNEK